MRMSDPVPSIATAPPEINRKWTACEDDKKLQKKEAGTAAGGEAPAIVHDVLRSPGQPLDAATRAYFEPRFGRDFSRVRVHTDAAAAQSAQDVNAHAYTAGHNMAFDAGRFAPGTQQGRRLIAHELTHVVQQSGSGGIRADLGNEKRGLSSFSLQQQVAAEPFRVRRVPGDVEPSPPAVSLTPNQARLVELMNVWVPDPVKQRLTTISRAAAIELKTGRQVYLIAIAGEGAALPLNPSLLRPDELLIPHTSGHAEIQTIRFAQKEGYKILPGALEPSRAFCTNCAWWARKGQLTPPDAKVRVGHQEKPLAEVSNRELTQNLGERKIPGSGGESTEKGKWKKAKRTPRLPPTAGEITVPQRGSATPAGGTARPVTTTAGEIGPNLQEGGTPRGGTLTGPVPQTLAGQSPKISTQARAIASADAQVRRAQALGTRLGLYFQAWQLLQQGLAALDAITTAEDLIAHGTALPKEQAEAVGVAKESDQAVAEVDDTVAQISWLYWFGRIADAQKAQNQTALDQIIDDLIKIKVSMEQSAQNLQGIADDLTQSSQRMREESQRQWKIAVRPQGESTLPNSVAAALWDATTRLSGTIAGAAENYAAAAETLRYEAKALNELEDAADDAAKLIHFERTKRAQGSAP
jgi:hypothetical protein